MSSLFPSNKSKLFQYPRHQLKLSSFNWYLADISGCNFWYTDSKNVNIGKELCTYFTESGTKILIMDEVKAGH